MLLLFFSLVLAGLVYGRLLFQSGGLAAWLGGGPAAPVSPPPYYAPLSGQAFITAHAYRAGGCLPLGEKPGQSQGLAFMGCKTHGTPVDILQSIWVIEAPGSMGCYYYLVRSQDNFPVGGWAGGYALASDPAQLSQGSCLGRIVATPTPASSPGQPPGDPLTGRAFLTTFKTFKESVDVWSQPGWSQPPADYLFSRPHGTPVDIVQSIWLVEAGFECYYYWIRTEDGLEGWVDAGVITNNIKRPAWSNCPR